MISNFAFVNSPSASSKPYQSFSLDSLQFVICTRNWNSFLLSLDPELDANEVCAIVDHCLDLTTPNHCGTSLGTVWIALNRYSSMQTTFSRKKCLFFYSIRTVRLARLSPFSILYEKQRYFKRCTLPKILEGWQIHISHPSYLGTCANDLFLISDMPDEYFATSVMADDHHYWEPTQYDEQVCYQLFVIVPSNTIIYYLLQVRGTDRLQFW